MRHQVETTVRGGFPVKLEFEIAPAEPDVGIFRPYVSDMQVMTTRGQSLRWLQLTPAELERLEEIAMEGGES